MYTELGPVDVLVPSYGNETFVPRLDQLWPMQVGYRFDADTGKTIPEWPDEWLVVAQTGGDPLGVHRVNSSVGTAHHGAGAWRWEVIADSLSDVIVGIGVLGAVVTEASGDLCDENFMVRRTHLRAAWAALAGLVEQELADRLLAWAEWTPTA